MTDRLNGFTVILADDIREDDAQGLIDAIRRLRGVAEVRPIIVDGPATVARMQERTRLSLVLMDFAQKFRSGE